MTATRDTPAPTICPFCASKNISAAGAKITASTYWRCEGCGQVWHPARLQERLEYGRPYR